MRKAALHNLGCKVNAYETEAMQELLEQNGYEIVPFHERADVYVINTCTVTNMADRKSRQMIHRAKKRNPDAVVVAAGCYVQTREEKLDESIDIVIGNNKKQELIPILEKYWEEKVSRNPSISGISREVIDIAHTSEYEKLCLTKTAEHTRAYIKVQDGCNQFCSYCIIPYVRGRARSRRKEEVLREVLELSKRGYKEIVLTGIHLSSYGSDCGEDLMSLILAVHDLDGLKRIRLGSLEPRVITEEFVSVIAKLPKICPHFHLSLQSGCDATLGRMNRHYSTREYYEKCLLLREYFYEPAITTDVIVGFPGETEKEFQESKAFIDQVNFYETHIFKYSRRKGTKADKMDGQVPEEVKASRSSELIELSRKKQWAYEEKLIGKTVEVLMEEAIMQDGEMYQVGHTKEYVKVGLKEEKKLSNHLINVEIKNRRQIIH